MARSRSGDVIPLRTATWAWFLISLQTFGGPAGQIAVMQHTLVDEKRWIGERRFLHALSYCMLLPGPEAQQLAVYTGWLLNGWAGGLIAGILFVLPGALAMLALSWAYVTQGDTTLVAGLFLGLAPAVLAIVVQAVLRIGKRALTRPALVALAVAAFLMLALLHVPFPLVVLGAGLVGWLLSKVRRGRTRARDRAGGGRAARARRGPAPRRSVSPPERVDPGGGPGRSGWLPSPWRSPSRADRSPSSPTRGSSSGAWPW